MKKLFSLILCICLLLSLTACNAQPPQETTPPTVPSDAPTETTENEVLEVWYLKTQFPTAQYITGTFQITHPGITVNATVFTEAEEMDLQLAAQISAGKGPDVVFFTDATTLDTEKMAMRGAFLDLNTLLAEDGTYNPENYFPVMNAGSLDGKQYRMPLRMRLPYLVTTPERAEQDLGLSEGYTASQLMQALTDNAAACPEDASAMQFSGDVFLGRGNMVYDGLRLSGLQVADLQSQKQTVSEADFKEFAQYARMSYVQFMKTNQLVRQNQINSFSGMFAQTTTVYTNQTLPTRLRYFSAINQQVLELDTTLLTFPNYHDPATITADITLYAAIGSNTQVPELAYALLREAMDYRYNDLNEDLPILRKNADGLLSSLSAQMGKTFQEGTVTVRVPIMTTQQKDLCKAIFDRISAGNIRNGAIGTIFNEAMEEYICGTGTLEDGYQRFVNQLEIYLYE